MPDAKVEAAAWGPPSAVAVDSGSGTAAEEVEELPRGAAVKSPGSLAAETAQENTESVVPDEVGRRRPDDGVTSWGKGDPTQFLGWGESLFIFSL